MIYKKGTKIEHIHQLKAYLFHITLYDAVLFGTLFILLTFCLLLWFTGQAVRTAHRFLAAALLIVILWAAQLLATAIGLPAYVPGWSLSPTHFLPALGPCLFFYVLRLTCPGCRFRRKDLLHLIPLLPGAALSAAAALESRRTGAPACDTAVYQQWGPVMQLLVFISLLVYLFLCRRLIQNFYRQLSFNSGDRFRRQWRWLDQLLVVSTALWLLWVPLYFYGHHHPDLQTCYPLYLLLLAMILATAVKTFLRTVTGMPAADPAALRPLLPEAMKQKANRVKNTIKANRYYEDPDLSLNTLAGKLGLSVHELSRLVNTVFKKTFNDFINEYRVKAVARKMQDPAYAHITLLGIAYGSGFNSQSSFTRVFKQITGKTPLEYKNEQKKGYPSYNLGSPPRSGAVVLRPKIMPSVMFKNYLRTAWRSLLRNKSYAVINVTGLAIGIAACLLIFLIVRYETSFDNFHTRKDRIYRIVNVSRGPDGVTLGSGTQLPLADGLRLDFPALTDVATIMLDDGSHYSVSDTKKFKEDLAYYADPQFFRVFDFKWLAGDKTTALAEPNTLVLSRDEADKFFGDWHNALGKTLRYENRRDLKVTGIIENTPVNTDFPMKVVMSWVTLVNKGGDLDGNARDWVSTFSDKNTYIILPAGISEKQFNAALAKFAAKHIPPPYNKTSSLQLQALKDMHYNTQVAVYGGHPFSKQLIDVISLIGLFLLVIACVNFVNLATAQAVNRSKEVGVRKVMGSSRFQLALQFISETFIITLFSVMIALVISVLALPMLNNLLEVQLSRRFLADPVVGLFLTGLILSVTFFAGGYPALVLSGFNPVAALKNKVNASRSSGISLRRVLVVTQFCIAQFLVIGTLVLICQMNYFKNKPLGFNKDAVITVPFPGDSIARTRISALKDQLLQQPGIKNVSVSLYGPADNSGWFSDFKFNNSSRQTDFGASLKWADPEYFSLYGIQFVAGGPYKNTDTISGYVVNETLIHKLGITDPKQAIGKYIMIWNDRKKNARITGVVKDFNPGSLKDAIPPVLMAPWKQFYAKLNIKIEPRGLQQTLIKIENLWNKTYPEGVYEYQFLDRTIADFYKNEDELSSLYKIFAGIAIFISCLGLYGLVSFMAVQRVKEVGIRKTLGASAGQIVYLFSREFIILVLIAFAIAAPAGYYFMQRWLQGFTYRITIGPGIFILAIASSLAIAWLAVGFKAVKAALSNPVQSLRSE